MNRKQIIEKYHMQPHAEGGYYAEIWQQAEAKASHIFYLLPKGEKALLHRIRSDELWLFHQGGKLTLTLWGKGDTPQKEREVTLGEEELHCLIEKDTWQSARAEEGDVLVSCVVSPAFAEKNWNIYEGMIE